MDQDKSNLMSFSKLCIESKEERVQDLKIQPCTISSKVPMIKIRNDNRKSWRIIRQEYVIQNECKQLQTPKTTLIHDGLIKIEEVTRFEDFTKF